MKKPVRLLLLGTALMLFFLLLAGGLVLHSGVQTWAARRALAGQTKVKASLGNLSAGFQTVELHDVRLEQDGAIIELPVFSAELSVIEAGLNQKISVRRLMAKGWTLDLTRFVFPSAIPATAISAAPVAAAAQIFQGIFAQSALPFDLVLDGVELEGDVLLPPAPGMKAGRAHLIFKGGGLAAGREGVFTFTTDVNLAGADLPVTTLSLTGHLAATMDTPRTFTRLGTQAEAAATGPQFPRGVKLAADITATRTATGESYSLVLSDTTRLLASLKADLPVAGRHLAGTWKLDVRDADLAPFTLGRALPVFALDGAGVFDAETSTGEVHLSGKLDASVDQLGVFRPELAVIGAVRLVTEFDVARRGASLRVEQLKAEVRNAHPVASVFALQPFEFNATTGQLKVADPARELLGLALHGLPLAWARPFIRDYTISGDDVRGEFTAMANNGGFALRAKAPLSVTRVSLAQGDRPLLRDVDLSLNPSADYTPQGWQAECSPLVMASDGQRLLQLEAKLGQLAGQAQPVKATGSIIADLPVLLRQPAATGLLVLTGGRAAGDFVFSVGATTELQTKFAVTELTTEAKLAEGKLPALTAEVRADVAANGVVTLTAPVAVDHSGRKSDLTLSGTLTPVKAGFAVDAHVTSALLVVQDLQLLAVPLAPAAPVPASADAKIVAPPWAGFSGRVALAFTKVVYSDLVQVTDVSGTLRLEAGAARLVNFKAGLGEGTEAKASGDLTFDARAARPFGLAADVVVNEFDPAPFFRAISPGQPPPVEGRFTLATKFSASVTSLSELAQASQGALHCTSKGGFFRGLPVSYAAKAETTGKLAAGVAAVGSLFGSVTGKKDYADIAGRAQAVAELTKNLSLVPYDQLNVVLTRDASFHTVLKDFTLIAPELRLSGSGTVAGQAPQSLLDGCLAMEFKLRARGRQGELLKYLGVLDSTLDDLGYVGCTLPLKVAGTLSRPDTTELNRALAGLALEKAGVTEKASELFNRLIGGGK